VAKSIALAQQSTLKEDSFSSPYLVARREWDERYGGLIKRAQQWRAAAILALLVALAEAIVIIGVATRPRIAPYVVAVDSLGRVAAAGPADRNSPVDERMKQAAITQWVQDMRGVTSDGLAERAAIDHVYAMIGSQSAAQTIVTDYFRANQPFERGSRETVQVEVNAILPNSPHSYEVDWTETQRTLDGKPISSDRWKGIFTVAINPSTDEAVLTVNPFGIYVMDMTWSKVL
jgi:type IV secretory pathway TrbF-like protein